MFVRIPWSLVSALIIPFVLAIGYSFMIKDRQVALSDDVRSISTQADILSDRMHRLDNRVTRLETVHEQKSHINRMSR